MRGVLPPTSVGTAALGQEDAGSSARNCEAGSVPNQRHMWNPLPS